MAGTTTNTTASTTPGTTTSYIQPSYYTDAASSMSGGLQGMLGDTGYLNNVMNNWYNQAPNQGALGQYAQYNPSQQSQFMNPYTQGAANEMMRLSNQNLNENVIPGLNSTFTGAGQFGSSRNSDFMNRAVRDNQQSINGNLANMYKGAYDTANTQYKDWTQMGLNAGQNDYKNWLENANFPVTSLSALGQVAGNLKPSNPAAVSVDQADMSTAEKVALSMAALNTGVTDGSLNSILQLLGLSSPTTTTPTTTTPV